MFLDLGKNAVFKAFVGGVALSLVAGGAFASENKSQEIHKEKSSEEKVVIKGEIEFEKSSTEQQDESEREPSASPAPSPSPSHSGHSSESGEEGEHVSPSPSPSASSSQSGNPEPRESEHPSASPSPSVTATPFPSSTDIFIPGSPSPTPTATPSGSPSGSVSPSPTPTGTTPGGFSSPTPTASPSASPSGSTPPAPSESPTPTPTPTPTPSESKLSNRQPTPPAPPGNGNLTIATPTPIATPNTGTPSYGEDGKLVRLNAPKSTIILTTPTSKPLSNPSANTGGTTNTGSTKYGYDDNGKVAPISGTITLTVGKKKIVANQIVPITQTLVVTLPQGTVKAEIYINGKKQSATVLSGTPFKLPGIIGPKDKVTIRAVDAKGSVVIAPLAYKAHPIALANVNFDFSSAKLTPAAIKILNKTIAVVRAHGFTSITLVGYTDSKTTKVFSNKKLSVSRSSAVMNYLTKAFAKYHIKITFKAAGKADTSPLTSNGTDQGRAINRRVEIDVQ